MGWPLPLPARLHACCTKASSSHEHVASTAPARREEQSCRAHPQGEIQVRLKGVGRIPKPLPSIFQTPPPYDRGGEIRCFFRVDGTPEGLVFVDYKTTSSAPKPDLQVPIYREAAARMASC